MVSNLMAICFLTLILCGVVVRDVIALTIEDVLNTACVKGDLNTAHKQCKSLPESAESLFMLASFELMLNSDGQKAVSYHRSAKSLGTGVVPPLAKLHLDGHKCGGLGDLFYVTAVIIKELVDNDVDSRKLLNGLTTLITLTADSGLPHAAEKHALKAIEIARQLNSSSELPSLLFRSALLTPGVFESVRHINKTRALLESRVALLLSMSASDPSAVRLKSLDEFVLSPTFYFVYQGLNDRALLSQLQTAYGIAHPPLTDSTEVDNNINRSLYHYQQQSVLSSSSNSDNSNNNGGRKIKVGFVSSYFRRHSICKLFCGVMKHLNTSLFDVVAFSSLQETHEDQHTLSLKNTKSSGGGGGGRGGGIEFVTLGKTLIQNRREVTDRAIDILVYLDVGMEPSTVVWASARLAPIQVCIWGHPSTTGLGSMDYYLSSQLYHTRHHYYTSTSDDIVVSGRSSTSTAQDYFQEQLVQFDSLNYFFERPMLQVLSSTAATATINIGGAVDMDNYRDLVERNEDFYESLVSSNPLGESVSIGLEALRKLKHAKLIEGKRLVLCTQHLPKFHPDFDHILSQVLIRDRNAVILLIDNNSKGQWKRTLVNRWRKSLTAEVNHLLQTSTLEELIALSGLHGRKFSGDSPLLNNSTATIEEYLDRIVWLPSLTPDEYLRLMAMGDVMLDPFPFGGGVTALEAFAVCTPVIALPTHQNVPSLAAGMITAMKLPAKMEHFLIVNSTTDYYNNVLQLLDADESDVRELRSEICSHSNKIFSEVSTVREWEKFFLMVVS